MVWLVCVARIEEFLGVTCVVVACSYVGGACARRSGLTGLANVDVTIVVGRNTTQVSTLLNLFPFTHCLSHVRMIDDAILSSLSLGSFPL